MKKFPRSVSYLLLFSFVFLLGWESSSYYISKRLAVEKNLKQEDISAVAAMSSILSSQPREQADLNIFWKVWGMLSDSYVDQKAVDKQQMVYGAIKGMTAGIGDPFTVYMTPDESKSFDQNLAGELEGIGAELTVRDQNLVVVSALKGSPAEKAGLKPDDIVSKIDGGLTADMSLFEAITKIRGQKGTKVVLTIIRKGEAKPLDVPIERDTVNVESVTLEDKGKGIFLMTLSQFNDKTKAEFEEQIRQLLLKDPKGLILDMRYNGGGLLEVAVDVISEFVSGKKVAVTIKRRDEADNQTLYTTSTPRLPDIPLVVLVNNGSASASEIVAGAIQDHKRGMIMGEQTYGKGSVQEVDPLSDGSSLRMTIAKWYTPSDKNIDKVGITPDIKAVVDEKEAKAGGDSQLDAALQYLEKLSK